MSYMNVNKQPIEMLFQKYVILDNSTEVSGLGGMNLHVEGNLKCEEKIKIQDQLRSSSHNKVHSVYATESSLSSNHVFTE